ncbi:MAG: hypothetical protein H7A31_04075 [Thermotogae bacterium]|nr:hypothetical protein [Thermotogota bacterium]
MNSFMDVAYPGLCKHEFVIDGSFLKEYGIKTIDVAKRLLDHGIHPPTTYFPLIVKEALMLEPTETESKETLEWAASVFSGIVEEAKNDPDILHNAPYKAPVKRLNDLKANKDLKIRA